MDVVSVCPLRVASLVWQPRRGSWALTVICKATFRLAPAEASLAPEQEYPAEEENHWNDDPARSLYSPSDLAPFKPSAEVTLVGHAFAPRGEHVSRLMVRLIVGEVDKSIEVRADQSFTHDGSLREGPRFTKMPMRYERAAGGPDTSNPVGLRMDSPNALGVTNIPNLRPPGSNVTSPRDFIEPTGFGPVASGWPARRDARARVSPAWTDASLAREPLPEGLEGRYFMAAPADQRLAELRADERLVLEHLHPDHPRLVTSLPGIEPRVFCEQPMRPPVELGMKCDTLWIDTDRSIATLTWRGQLELASPDAPGRVVVGMASVGQPLGWADVDKLSAARSSAAAHEAEGGRPRASMPIDDTDTHYGAEGDAVTPAALPFAGAGAVADPARGPASWEQIRSAGVAAQRASTEPLGAPRLETMELTPDMIQSVLLAPKAPRPPPPAPPPPRAIQPDLPTSPTLNRDGTPAGPAWLRGNPGQEPMRAGAPRPPPAPMTLPIPPSAVAAIPIPMPVAPALVAPPAPAPMAAPPRPSAPALVVTPEPAGASAPLPSAPAMVPSAGGRPASPWAGSAGAAPPGPLVSFGTAFAPAPAPIAPAPVAPPPSIPEAPAIERPLFGAPASPSPVNRVGASWLGSVASTGGEPKEKALFGASRPEADARGVAAASNAAALAGAARATAGEAAIARAAAEIAPGAPLASPAPPAIPRDHAVDLLWYDAGSVARIRASKAFAGRLDKAAASSWLSDDKGPRTDAQEARDRRDVLRFLVRGQPLDEAGLERAAVAAFQDDGTYASPIELLAGELALCFDEVEILRATITVTTPFLGIDKKLRDVVTAASEVLDSKWSVPIDIAEGNTARIEEAFAQGPRAVPAGYLQNSVERMLLEGRKLQKKTIGGERRVRALMSLAGSKNAIPAYLPEAVEPRLPLFRRFRAVAIAEIRPREDQFETHGDALLVLALGRLIPARR